MPQGEISTETGWARKNAAAVVSLRAADLLLYLAKIFRGPAGAAGPAFTRASRSLLRASSRER